jgi:NitT/TauT family transport system ATP-binding protein
VVVLTPRPGRVRAELAVPLPRPRRLHVLTSPEFTALKRQALELLLGRDVGAASDGIRSLV